MELLRSETMNISIINISTIIMLQSNETSSLLSPPSLIIDCAPAPAPLLVTRFYIVVCAGLLVAGIGLVCNTLICCVFFGRRYRNSAMFFLGCVAAFDADVGTVLFSLTAVALETLAIDLTYILILVVPIAAEYYALVDLYMLWINYVQELFTCGQICKVASVYALIAASFERYMIVRHWTMTTGFARATRFGLLVVIIIFAIFIKLPAYFDMIIVWIRGACDPFNSYQVCFVTVIRKTIQVGSVTPAAWLLWTQNALCIFVPFIALVVLNGGIVIMLRQKNVQQLRALIAELTVGRGLMRRRGAELRSATNTLLVIISIQIISNMLNILLTLFEYFDGRRLKHEHRDFYRLASDAASLLTVVGNAIRFPVYILSDGDIRQELVALLMSVVACNNVGRNKSTVIVSNGACVVVEKRKTTNVDRILSTSSIELMVEKRTTTDRDNTIVVGTYKV